jgi:hypothetical protein
MQLDILKSKQGEGRSEWKVIPGWSWIDMEPDEVTMGSGRRQDPIITAGRRSSSRGTARRTEEGA